MSLTNMFRKIELLANVAIVLIAILIGGVFVKNYFLNNSETASQIKVGTKVSLPEVDWAKNNQTLLLVLSNNCHFCTESAPFYQRLVQETSKSKNAQLIAVMPQEVSEGKHYLNDLGVSISDVRQIPLDSLKVKGTPTLLLIDNKGIVADLWAGKLSADKESEVLDRLNLRD